MNRQSIDHRINEDLILGRIEIEDFFATLPRANGLPGRVKTRDLALFKLYVLGNKRYVCCRKFPKSEGRVRGGGVVWIPSQTWMTIYHRTLNPMGQ